MEQKDPYIIQLEQENAYLRSQLLELTEKLSVLLSSKVVAKDSHNSSLPPSLDKPSVKSKRTQSRRKTSGRKSGGQKGHQGKTLDFSGLPDQIEALRVYYCRTCGTDLAGAEAIYHSRRQVFDVILPKTSCIEYRAYSCICPICGTKNVADYPLQVQAPVQYGAQVGSLVSYFSHYQFIPYQRLQKLFSDVFDLSLSQGSISNLLSKMGQKSTWVCEQIKGQLSKSKVVGSDETGVNVNGKNQWIWVWQDSKNTLLTASPSRGRKVVAQMWQQGLPQAVLVSDRWASQVKTPSAGKQLCLAHLQRDIQYLQESETAIFATDFAKWLDKVWQAKKQSVQREKPYLPTDLQALDLEMELNQLLLYPIDKEKHKLTAIFQRSMCKYRDYLLTTLYHLEVPADNNASERAIRNVKVKQKVSALFKSGQQDFCAIRSVIDTAIKRGKNILITLFDVYRYAT